MDVAYGASAATEEPRGPQGSPRPATSANDNAGPGMWATWVSKPGQDANDAEAPERASWSPFDGAGRAPEGDWTSASYSTQNEGSELESATPLSLASLESVGGCDVDAAGGDEGAEGDEGDGEDEDEEGGEESGDADDLEGPEGGEEEESDAAVGQPEPVLLRSLFEGRPATLCFPRSPSERRPGTLLACPVPADTHARVKSYWERRAVRGAVRSAGAALVKGRSFNLLWGKHLKPPQLQELLPHQKVNHFPGTWCIGRKDRLWRTLSRARREHGRGFDFLPHSCKLPHDKAAMQATLEREPRSLWIRKPCASSCGRGIRVVTAQEAARLCGRASARRPFLLQRYVHDPLLIDGYKFDLRIYVAVTSFDPLRVYIHEEGLARFCTQPYSLSLRNLKNRLGHLTNYSLNKNSDDFVANRDASDDGEGSKWSLGALLRALAARGVDTGLLMARISDVVVKTLIAAEGEVATEVAGSLRDPRCCFELFGFDLMVDRALRPWLVEVNVSPSIMAASPLDRRVKGRVVSDLFHMVGLCPADTKRAVQAASRGGVGVRHLRARARPRSAAAQRLNVFDLERRGPAALTPGAADVIREAEDEHARRGAFVRVFPTPRTGPYAAYFPCRRIGNELLAAWLQRPAWRAKVAPLLGYRDAAALEAALRRPQAACLLPACAVTGAALDSNPASRARSGRTPDAAGAAPHAARLPSTQLRRLAARKRTESASPSLAARQSGAHRPESQRGARSTRPEEGSEAARMRNRSRAAEDGDGAGRGSRPDAIDASPLSPHSTRSAEPALRRRGAAHPRLTARRPLLRRATGQSLRADQLSHASRAAAAAAAAGGASSLGTAAVGGSDAAGGHAAPHAGARGSAEDEVSVGSGSSARSAASGSRRSQRPPISRAHPKKKAQRPPARRGTVTVGALARGGRPGEPLAGPAAPRWGGSQQ